MVNTRNAKNKLLKRIINIINVAVVLTVIIFGNRDLSILKAAESDDISGEITVLFNLGTDIMAPYIETFEQKYPNVKVNYECVSDYETQMVERFESGDYGDVLYVPSFIQSDEITSYFAPIGNYYRLSEKYNHLENAYVSANILYTIPSSAYLMGIAYNKDVFYMAGISELPQTIDEFLEDLSMIKERTSATPIYLASQIDWILKNWIDFPYLEMTGDADYKGSEFVYEKNPFTEGGTFYEVYRLIYEIVANEYCESEDSNISWDQIATDLNSGKCASVAVGSWALNQIKSVGDGGDSISFMPFPNSINGTQYMTLNTNYCYAISRNCTNRKAAEAFLDFMLDESGYATDYDNISIVKTDYYPDTYGDMENVVLASNNAYKGNAYNLYKQMTSDGVDPTSADEIRTIVEAARKGESYESVMKSWNTRWEKSRPSTMTVKDRADFAAKAAQSEQSTDGNNLDSIYMKDYEVEFSDTEKEYIDTKQKLKVGYVKDKAPFQYQSAVSSEGLNDQNFAGLSAYLCNTIEETSGIEIEYVAYKNETEVISALRSGKIDMGAGIKTTDLDGIKYSKDYIELTNVIIKNENVDTNNLEGSRQVLVEGEVYDVDVVNNYVSVEASTLSNAIKEVNNHNADFTIADYYSAEYYINEAEYTHVSVIPLTSKTKLAFAYAGDVDTRLISITNKCIYSLSEEEMQVLLMQNMDSGSEPVTLRRFIETNPILAMILGMSVVAVIAVAIFFVGHEKRKSERKHEIDNKRYKILSQLTDEYVFEYDLKSAVVHFENKFVDKFNFSQNVNVSDYDKNNEALKVLIENCNLAKQQDTTTIDGFEITDVSGSTQWYRMIAYRILDSNGRPRHIIGKIMNIQKTMEETRRIQDEADRDALTGIYNRNGFDKSFNALCDKYGNNAPCVFVMLDFDSFKAVNDSLGHEGGDTALKLLGDNLADIERDNVICARYGGDEFMICMFGITHDKASGVLKDLIRKMNTDLVFHGVTHHISISIGAVYSDTVQPFHKLFGEADAVLYDVKANGKNGYKIINI